MNETDFGVGIFPLGEDPATLPHDCKWRESYYGFECDICGAFAVDSYFDDVPDFEDYHNAEDDAEPVGSCDNCESNLYRDDVYYIDDMRLCGQCAWLTEH
jgi:hypothetical protein